MYWEESGNPAGIPVLFLHGGPGTGTSPRHRRFFDPVAYRIILLDQRGAGRSTPLGELRNNTTPLLIEDIEKLREMLGIGKWLIFGGSWGSTLSIAYAETHPDRCLGLILRGIFLCRPLEVDWFLYGMRNFFPEHWETFVSVLPEDERDNLLENFYRRLNDPDPAIHVPAARAWSAYEGKCITLLPDPTTAENFASDTVALGLGRLEAHYFIHNIFLPDNSLLKNIDRIRHLPTVIIQGRYDICCPPRTAHELKTAWPEAEFIMIEDAGHAATEPGIERALVAACDRFKTV
jgi:proline iminopeptidase